MARNSKEEESLKGTRQIKLVSLQSVLIAVKSLEPTRGLKDTFAHTLSWKKTPLPTVVRKIYTVNVKIQKS